MRFRQCSVGASFLALLIVASFSLQPVVTQKIFTQFHVCYVNTMEKDIVQGKVIIIIFGVFYSDYSPCGDPCDLKARLGQTQPTASFVTTGSPALRFTEIPVTPTGKPGEYRAEISWPTEAPIGKMTAFIIKDSLYDGKRTGPDNETSHVETPDPIDDSTFNSIRSAHPIVAFFDFMPGGFATFAALLTLLILLVVILLLVARRRQKK